MDLHKKLSTLLLYLAFYLCSATIDLNLAELQYLADHLTTEECRRLVAAAHFKSFEEPNALDKAERKVPKDENCIDHLIHWNSKDGEGKGESHEILGHRLRQMGKIELADWLGKTVFHQLGEDLEKGIKEGLSETATDISSQELSQVTLEPLVPKIEEPTKYSILDSLLYQFIVALSLIILGLCFKLIWDKMKAAVKKRNPTATGFCNVFPCGDISPETLEKIRENLRKKSYSFIIDEGSSITLMNDREMLKTVKKESPEAFFEWTLNGVFINKVTVLGDDTFIKSAKPSDSGIYVSMIYRMNQRWVVLKVISLSVRAKNFDVDTRATWSYNLKCHSVILGYVYSDLSLKHLLNNETYLDHGITTIEAVNTLALSPLNRSHSGVWACVTEQKDLKLKWITNYVKINVKKKPNFYTHLIEDKLTAPLFGHFKNEEVVLAAVILIVLVVVLGVAGFLFVYMKYCTLKSRYKRNRRF